MKIPAPIHLNWLAGEASRIALSLWVPLTCLLLSHLSQMHQKRRLSLRLPPRCPLSSMSPLLHSMLTPGPTPLTNLLRLRLPLSGLRSTPTASITWQEPFYQSLIVPRLCIRENSSALVSTQLVTSNVRLLTRIHQRNLVG
jgi:hypothetical protein